MDTPYWLRNNQYGVRFVFDRILDWSLLDFTRNGYRVQPAKSNFEFFDTFLEEVDISLRTTKFGMRINLFNFFKIVIDDFEGFLVYF